MNSLMRNIRPLQTLLALAGALLLLGTGARADDYDLSWHTMGSGGGSSSGGGYTIDGTVGQPDAGGIRSAPNYQEASGYWNPFDVACAADINQDSHVTVQDLFLFLQGWFQHSAVGDFNGNGQITPQDIFDYLMAFFAGCA